MVIQEVAQQCAPMDIELEMYDAKDSRECSRRPGRIPSALGEEEAHRKIQAFVA